MLALAGPATAHVRVIAEATPGQPATLRFRVPSELAGATTVRVAVAVPPALSVTAVPPIDGWTQKTVPGSAGRATRLIWTAKPRHGIEPDDHVSFNVRVGPLPNQRSATFNTEQTYSNGTIATWNQDQDGSKEPPYPAPVLLIDPAAPPSPADQDVTPRPTTAELVAPHTRAPSTVATSADSASTAEEGTSARLMAVIGAGVVTAAAISAALARRRRKNHTARS
ncbi:hypothetical protein Sfulv_60250 [Streptomyces fulvorobeus]|uniref:YncI copper-binding domain-containing protein n=1 Tax=Streptomyces fulvorobeus TaxID=284028 RepID=A0A7J0CHF0_9ACTN|nr:hypothetical protein Sfulv_60250 [Streptomyces fulvorobeus]